MYNKKIWIRKEIQKYNNSKSNNKNNEDKDYNKIGNNCGREKV